MGGTSELPPALTSAKGKAIARHAVASPASPVITNALGLTLPSVTVSPSVYASTPSPF